MLRVIAGNAYKFHIKYSFFGLKNLYKSSCLCIFIPELMPENQPRDIMGKCINICSAELGIDSQRIADWLYAKSVLCWAWSLEDNLDPSYWHNLLENITE